MSFLDDVIRTPVGEPTDGKPQLWTPTGPQAQEYINAHNNADTDQGPNSIHHTIGEGPFQAASGALMVNALDRINDLEVALASTQVALTNTQANLASTQADLDALQTQVRRRVSGTSGAFSMTANYTLGTFSLERYGDMVEFYAEFTRSAGSITAVANGDFANSTIATLAANWRPLAPNAVYSGVTGKINAGYISTAGVLALSATGPGYGILNGETFSLYGNWVAY